MFEPRFTTFEKEEPVPQTVEPSGFVVIDATEFSSEPPEVKWCIHNLLPAASVAALVGRSSSLKSWLALYIALRLASGQHVLPDDDTQADQGDVLFIDFENGRDRLHRRLWAMRNVATVNSRLRFVSHPNTPLGSVAFEDAFIAYVAQFGEPKLVVIDTYRAATPGLDENDSSSRESIDHLKRLAEAYNTTFLLIHHAGKGKLKGLDMARGSSAFVDALDAMLTVEREAPDKNEVLLQLAKDRDGGDHRKYIFELGGHLPSFAVLRPDDGQTTASQPQTLEAKVLAAIKATPGVKKVELRRQVQSSNESVTSAVKALKERGEISSSPKDGYRLTSTDAKEEEEDES